MLKFGNRNLICLWYPSHKHLDAVRVGTEAGAISYRDLCQCALPSCRRSEIKEKNSFDLNISTQLPPSSPRCYSGLKHRPYHASERSYFSFWVQPKFSEVVFCIASYPGASQRRDDIGGKTSWYTSENRARTRISPVHVLSTTCSALSSWH